MPSWLKRESTKREFTDGEFTVNQNNEELLQALVSLDVPQNGLPILTEAMIHNALASRDGAKLMALGVLANHGALDPVQLAKNVFNCKDEELFDACASGLALGDRKKLNTIKLLLDQKILEVYADAERITGLSPLFLPLLRETENPTDLSGWAEGQSTDFPDRTERLDVAFGVEAEISRRKYQIIQSIAPELERSLKRSIGSEVYINYYADTHGILCSTDFAQAMFALGYDRSDNGFAMRTDQGHYGPNQNHNVDFFRAIQSFEKVCKLPAITLSNTFQKLAAHHNRLCIYAGNKLQQAENAKRESEMQAIREALDCARNIPEEYLTHQGVKNVIAEIFNAALNSWEHFSNEERTLLEQDCFRLLQTNTEFLTTVNGPFYNSIFQQKFLRNSDIKSRDEFAALLMDAEEKTGQHFGYRQMICMEQWKESPTMEALEKILEFPTLLSLEYFDLFQHAQDSEAKRKIAQKVSSDSRTLFDETNPSAYYWQDRLHTDRVLSLFGLSMVNTYHLLQKNDPPPSSDFLVRTLSAINTCANLLVNRFFDGAEIVGEAYSDNDIKLLINIAFQAKSVQVELLSAPFVTALCEGRDPAFQGAVQTWEDKVRTKNEIMQDSLNASHDENAKFYRTRQEFAQHCVDEFARVQYPSQAVAAR
jgi:hypothetical protein